MPKRIQRKRTKGWRNPPNTIYVGRPGKWGNPFVVGRDGNREECIGLFRALCNGFYCFTRKARPEDQERLMLAVRDDINELRGLNLSCFCKEGESCHADILLKLANQ